MKKLFFILLFSIFIQSTSFAKTKSMKFEVKSVNSELIKCIKIIDVKSKRSLLKTLGNMGLGSETGFIIRMQNNCSETLKGYLTFKLLDKEGFVVDDYSNIEFSVGRKGISKSTFKFLIGTLAWKKIQSSLIEVEFDNSVGLSLSEEIEQLKGVIYGN